MPQLPVVTADLLATDNAVPLVNGRSKAQIRAATRTRSTRVIQSSAVHRKDRSLHGVVANAERHMSPRITNVALILASNSIP